MATPVPTEVGKITATGTGTITIPNTNPPAVGDLLVAFLGAYQSGGSRNWGSAPAGFAELEANSGNSHIIRLMVKVATSDDVAAANFAFTVSSAADVVAGALFKVVNQAYIPPGTDSEYDDDGTSFTETTDLTPATAESIMMVLYSTAQNDSSGGNISGYASTPALTWQELLDTPGNNGSPAMSFAVAYANITGTSNYTQRTATGPTSSQFRSVALIINGFQNASGTAALLSATPAFFAPVGSAGTFGTAALLQGSPTIFAPTASEDSPSDKWIEEDLPDTDWENESLP